MSAYTIRQGDTLGALARRFGTTIDALAKANNIQDVDKIYAGRKLEIPGKQDDFGKRETSLAEFATTGSQPKYDPRKAQLEDAEGTGASEDPRRGQDEDDETTVSGLSPTQPGSKAPDAAWTDEKTGRVFPARDGAPIYAQGDKEWGGNRLGPAAKSKSLGRAGCAVSACAMAVSKMSGKTITPPEMDAYLDQHKGYVGDSAVFSKTGAAAGEPKVTSTRRNGLSVAEIDQELAAGRPVVIGVDYHKGGNARGTDHWMTVTARNPDGSYNVSDPAGGKAITMKAEHGTLVTAGGTNKPYRFTGDAVTFAGGNPNSRPTPAPIATRPTTSEAPTSGAPPDEATLGSLSQKYESGNRGPGEVSGGQGDPGGVSYGTYQLSSKTKGKPGGTATEFVNSLKSTHPDYYQALAGKTPGSEPFSKAWKALAAKDPKGFGAVQHDFIRRTHYEPQKEAVEKATGIDFEKRSKTLRDVLWSTADQHRTGTAGIFKKALAGRDPSKVSDAELIRAIYAERGRTNASGTLVHFPSSSPKVQAGVARRFRDEVKDALAALGRE